VKRRKVEMF